MNEVVGVADCKSSGNKEAILVTYALGSCIAVAVHDASARVGGLLHYMLPDSSIDPARAVQNPYMFADTGIPRLLKSVLDLGGQKRQLTVYVAGGAQMMDANGVFNVGKRNYLALRKLLWTAGLMIHAESVGGMITRTVRLEVGTGRLLSRENGADRELAASKNGRGGT